jgi:hypothetical protein
MRPRLLAWRAVIDVEATEPTTSAHRPPASRLAGVISLLRRHRALVLLLAAGAVLRIVAMVAVYPGIWFSDSNGYVSTAASGTLNPTRVSGYSLVVAPFWQIGSAALLIITQHIVGLGIAVLLYALLRRRGVSPLLAVLAVVPVVLDAYLIQIEHTMMSETVFHAALVLGIAVLLWNERPGLATAAAAGLLLGYAAIVRSVAVPLIAVFLLYLIVRRVGWRPVLAFGLGWCLVIGGYATLYKIQHGKFGLTQSNGRFLYGKVAPFADCSRLSGVPANERFMCPDPRNPLTTNSAMWGRKSPIRGKPPSWDKRIRDFAMRVIRDRPLTYARVVALDFLHYFEPGHRIGRNDPLIVQWEFPTDPSHWGIPGYRGPIRPGHAVRGYSPKPYVSRMVDKPHWNASASKALHIYQRFAFTSGQVLAICVILVLVALALRRGALRLRLDAALIAGSVLALLLFASAVSVFSYRYGLTAVVLLPAAAALAGAALTQRKAG